MLSGRTPAIPGEQNPRILPGATNSPGRQVRLGAKKFETRKFLWEEGIWIIKIRNNGRRLYSGTVLTLPTSKTGLVANRDQSWCEGRFITLLCQVPLFVNRLRHVHCEDSRDNLIRAYWKRRISLGRCETVKFAPTPT